MPLYEFTCRSCGHVFEALVRDAAGPACPSCNGQSLERLLSTFAVSSETTRGVALASGRQRQAKELRDKRAAEHEALHQHHD